MPDGWYLLISHLPSVIEGRDEENYETIHQALNQRYYTIRDNLEDSGVKHYSLMKLTEHKSS